MTARGRGEIDRQPGVGSDPPTTTGAEIDAFIATVKAMPQPVQSASRGSLIFAIDATMSRQPAWDMALALQSSMFDAVQSIGGLDVQLVYFRGHDECRASQWTGDAAGLQRLMTGVECRGGHTQIRKVLVHARREAASRPVNALVLVGDAMEEALDDLAQVAGELALLRLPIFAFQEGRDGQAATAFRELARLTRGAYCRFGAGAAEELRRLLEAVAVYAAGGRAALQDLGRGKQGSGARLLLEQLK